MDNNRYEFDKWFKQAGYDVSAAEASRRAFNYEWACFQSQQGAEKALKAYLLLKGKRMDLRHSINKLLSICLEDNKRFKEISGVRELDKYYIPTRYPDGLPDDTPHDFYTDEDAEKCINLSKRALSLIKELTRS